MSDFGFEPISVSGEFILERQESFSAAKNMLTCVISNSFY